MTALAVPGKMPRSPVTTLGPVLLTAEAPRTPKLCAVPNEGAVAANAKEGPQRIATNPTSTNNVQCLRVILNPSFLRPKKATAQYTFFLGIRKQVGCLASPTAKSVVQHEENHKHAGERGKTPASVLIEVPTRPTLK